MQTGRTGVPQLVVELGVVGVPVGSRHQNTGDDGNHDGNDQKHQAGDPEALLLPPGRLDSVLVNHVVTGRQLVGWVVGMTAIGRW